MAILTAILAAAPARAADDWPLTDAEWVQLAEKAGYAVVRQELVKPLQVRYKFDRPQAIRQYFLKAKQETQKGSKTYPRFYVLVSRFKDWKVAKNQAICPSVATKDHRYEKSMYVMCKGLTFGAWTVEVMTDAAVFTYGYQDELMAAVQDRFDLLGTIE